MSATKDETCPRCSGEGRIHGIPAFSLPGTFISRSCNVCKGTGVLVDTEARIAALTAALAEAVVLLQRFVKLPELYIADDGSGFVKTVRAFLARHVKVPQESKG